MHGHFEETLQRDIDRIRGKITEIGALADRALKDSLAALRERSRQLAYSVILRDQRIDEFEKEIDRLCLEFLVRQQPVAGTLRFVYAAIKINLELERVGDYAESIARQMLTLDSIGATVPGERLSEIAAVAIPMVEQAVQAFVDRDPELAKKVMATEDVVDLLRHKINADLVQKREHERISPEALAPLMMIVNRFERVADQAKNICQEVVYMCTGEYSKHKGGEVYRLLFVDRHNACRSQMAEALGNALGQAKFFFSSAGLEPTRVDETTVAFLREKGIDMSRQTPHALEQVPHLEHYQVIIALAEEARKIFPPAPTKTVCIDWSLKDPSQVTGTAEAVWAAYEEAYQFLKTNIQSLVNAILGDEAS